MIGREERFFEKQNSFGIMSNEQIAIMLSVMDEFVQKRIRSINPKYAAILGHEFECISDFKEALKEIGFRDRYDILDNLSLGRDFEYC